MFICFVPGSPRLDSATRGARSASTVYVKKCNKVVLLSTSWVIVNFFRRVVLFTARIVYQPLFGKGARDVSSRNNFSKDMTTF